MRCAACLSLRERITPTHPPCDEYRLENRLCKIIDRTLLDHADCSTFLEFRKLQGLLDVGAYVSEKAFVEFPKSPDEFIRMVLAIHEVRFGRALPTFGGRFRQPGEDVQFGGGGLNNLVGAPAEDIVAELEVVHATAMTSFTNPREDEPGRRCAIFLEGFFRVHPFPDGNGRVGRQLARLLCELDGRHTFQAFPTDPKNRRKYVGALEHAHRHAPKSENPGRRHELHDYGRHLQHWMEAQVIRERAEPILLEEPPEWADATCEDDEGPED